MRYLSVAEIAKKWNVSERSVRNYCAQGRVNGCVPYRKELGNIPENALRNRSDPTRRKKNRLLCWIFCRAEGKQIFRWNLP